MEPRPSADQRDHASVRARNRQCEAREYHRSVANHPGRLRAGRQLDDRSLDTVLEGDSSRCRLPVFRCKPRRSRPAGVATDDPETRNPGRHRGRGAFACPGQGDREHARDVPGHCERFYAIPEIVCASCWPSQRRPRADASELTADGRAKCLVLWSEGDQPLFHGVFRSPIWMKGPSVSAIARSRRPRRSGSCRRRPPNQRRRCNREPSSRPDAYTRCRGSRSRGSRRREGSTAASRRCHEC
jgi:hypothetical protein